MPIPTHSSPVHSHLRNYPSFPKSKNLKKMSRFKLRLNGLPTFPCNDSFCLSALNSSSRKRHLHFDNQRWLMVFWLPSPTFARTSPHISRRNWDIKLGISSGILSWLPPRQDRTGGLQQHFLQPLVARSNNSNTHVADRNS